MPGTDSYGDPLVDPWDLAHPQPEPPDDHPDDQPEDEDDDEGDGWPNPEPLAYYADPIPTDALGPVLGPIVDAVTVAFQVPSDVAVTLALPLITMATFGRWTVVIRRGWTEVVALATLSVLESSGRKTPAQNALAAPLRAFEEQAHHGAKELRARERARHQIIEDRAEKLRKKIGSTTDAPAGSFKAAEAEKLRRDYTEAVVELEEHQVPRPPRFIVDDVTPEALAKIMGEQDGAIGLVSDEGGIFHTLAGRYASGVANLDGVLKGISGSPIGIDRKSDQDDGIYIPRPRLSICLAMQPGLMARLGDRPEFRESGLLGRFLPVLPRSTMGYREINPPPVPDEVAAAWSHGIRNLARTALELRASAATEQTPPEGQPDERGRRQLELQPAAAVLLTEFATQLEPQFREGGPLNALNDFGGKLVGSAARIAAAITLLSDPDATVVDADTMRDAIRVADAYIDHARTTFGTMSGANPASPTSQVVKWLRERGQATVPHREVHRAFQKKPWARTTKDMYLLMTGLEDRGYVRADQRVPEGGRGGRPSKVWDVNPAVLATTEPREHRP